MKLLILLLLLSSCATILNDKTQKINVLTSNNRQVKFSFDGEQFSAPGIIEVARAKKDAILSVQDSKCTPQMLIKSDIDNKFWINVLSGGPLGSSTDYSTDKMWKYQDTIIIQCFN